MSGFHSLRIILTVSIFVAGSAILAMILWPDGQGPWTLGAITGCLPYVYYFNIRSKEPE